MSTTFYLTWDRNSARGSQTCPLPFCLTWDQNNAPRSQTRQLQFVLSGTETMHLAAKYVNYSLSNLGSK